MVQTTELRDGLDLASSPDGTREGRVFAQRASAFGCHCRNRRRRV